MSFGTSGMGFGTPGPTGKPRNVKGTGMKSVTMQNFSPEQMQLFQQLFGRLGPDSFMGRLAGGDQSQFEQMEAPAMRQFAGLQGNIASRFSAGGGGPNATSARRSSGFANATNTAASDFAQTLQSQRMGLQMNAWDRLMNMSNSLLEQRPYENFLVAKKQPFWQQAAIAGTQGLSESLGKSAGAWFGGV